MVKVTILYGYPSDPGAFEERYTRHVREFIDEAHIPGLVRFDASKAIPGPSAQPPFYRTADLWFESIASLQAARDLKKWQDGIKDLATFADGGFQAMVCSVDTKELTSTGS